MKKSQEIDKAIYALREQSGCNTVGVYREPEDALVLHFYAIELCEICERPTMGPNPLSVRMSEREYVNRAEARADYIGVLDELGACEALGGIAVCPTCWTEVADDFPVAEHGTDSFAVAPELPTTVAIPVEFATRIADALHAQGEHGIAAMLHFEVVAK